jgi:hypothetical protein
MSDRLYLSCWIEGYSGFGQLRHYKRLLEAFPFSNWSEAPQVMRVYGVEYAEPPVVEKPFEPTARAADIVAAAQDFTGSDCACDLDTAWDLWQFTDDWKLSPAAVTITSFGPEFDHDSDDHLRIDFGLDAKFLPLPGVEGSIRMQQSNLRSLLHLTSEIEKTLPLSRRQLWSESGANFAEILKKAVSDFSVQ